ncbi:MAG TPA: hypothetical protein VLU46_17370, partial [Thermoanaerobaculia bacterium]|nr:hypothetical protein [Thermoanaerobaculia bacterium]
MRCEFYEKSFILIASGPAIMLSRLLAALIDILIVFCIGLPLTPFLSSAVLIVGGAIVIYRYLFGRTPGQQLASGSWQRGLIALAAIAYLGSTIGGGFFIGHLTDEKIDLQRVAVTPVDIARPAPPAAGERQEEFEHVSFIAPRNADRYAAEEVSCCVLFGGGSDEAVVQPGIAVAVMSDL